MLCGLHTEGNASLSTSTDDAVGKDPEDAHLSRGTTKSIRLWDKFQKYISHLKEVNKCTHSKM